jgi:tetratricopeptide (TPR) repeat protein
MGATILVCVVCRGSSAVANVAGITPLNSSSKIVAETLKRGEELRRRWNLEAAETAFREAAALDPASLDAVLGLARIARARLEYGRALGLLNQSAAGHRDAPELLSEYGSIYLAAEEPERARSYFEEALQIEPASPSAVIGMSAAYLFERDYDKATALLRNLLVQHPQNSAGHSTLARIMLESGRTLEAADEARRAIALDGYNVEGLYTLAYVKSIERNADEARSLAWRVVSLDSFNFGARRLLSQYLDGQAGYEQTIPEQARVYCQRARSLKREGQLSMAAVAFEQALDVEPRYYRALIGLADLRLRLGQYERAAAVAKQAIDIDSEGASAHLELSCAYRGLNERARIDVGAVDFASQFYSRSAPPAYAATREIFPNYFSLNKKQQEVVDSSVAPLSSFLPALASHKARHYLLALDERPSELSGFTDVGDEKTFDGRYYASIRGVGGRIAVSGIEYLDQAARGGFNTIAHEFAHQVHIAALSKSEIKTVRKLYERARKEGRTLDYYSAANEYEYFAQGYEAFISEKKRPALGITARHTRSELLKRDPELHGFLVRLCGRHR